MFQDGRVYMAANGDSKHMDNGQIVALDLKTGDIKAYDFDRTNMTQYVVEGNDALRLMRENNGELEVCEEYLFSAENAYCGGSFVS